MGDLVAGEPKGAPPRGKQKQRPSDLGLMISSRALKRGRAKPEDPHMI